MCLFLPPVRRGLGVEFVSWHIVEDVSKLPQLCGLGLPLRRGVTLL